MITVLDNSARPDSSPSPPPMGSLAKFYLLVFLLLLTVGFTSQMIHLKSGLAVTQLLVILLPALWYRRAHGIAGLPLGGSGALPGRVVPAVLGLAASIWILNLMLVGWMFRIFMRWGYKPVEVLPSPQTGGEYLLFLLLIALLPGICEEILFRGTIMPALQEHGPLAAVVFSSFLFALFHVSFTNLVSAFLLGLVMGLLVVKTGSLWSAIIYHITNNFLAVTALYLAEAANLGEISDSAPEMWALPLLLVPLAAAAAVLSYRYIARHSAPPVLPNSARTLLPRGWLNWATVLVVVLYLGLVSMEIMVGFDFIQIDSGGM